MQDQKLLTHPWDCGEHNVELMTVQPNNPNVNFGSVYEVRSRGCYLFSLSGLEHSLGLVDSDFNVIVSSRVSNISPWAMLAFAASLSLHPSPSLEFLAFREIKCLVRSYLPALCNLPIFYVSGMTAVVFQLVAA